MSEEINIEDFIDEEIIPERKVTNEDNEIKNEEKYNEKEKEVNIIEETNKKLIKEADEVNDQKKDVKEVKEKFDKEENKDNYTNKIELKNIEDNKENKEANKESNNTSIITKDIPKTISYNVGSNTSLDPLTLTRKDPRKMSKEELDNYLRSKTNALIKANSSNANYYESYNKVSSSNKNEYNKPLVQFNTNNVNNENYNNNSTSQIPIRANYSSYQSLKFIPSPDEHHEYRQKLNNTYKSGTDFGSTKNYLSEFKSNKSLNIMRNERSEFRPYSSEYSEDDFKPYESKFIVRERQLERQKDIGFQPSNLKSLDYNYNRSAISVNSNELLDGDEKNFQSSSGISRTPAISNKYSNNTNYDQQFLPTNLQDQIDHYKRENETLKKDFLTFETNSKQEILHLEEKIKFHLRINEELKEQLRNMARENDDLNSQINFDKDEIKRRILQLEIDNRELMSQNEELKSKIKHEQELGFKQISELNKKIVNMGEISDYLRNEKQDLENFMAQTDENKNKLYHTLKNLGKVRYY